MRYYSVSSFWLKYFIIRLCYLFFTVFIYMNLISMGDMNRYLMPEVRFSPAVFYYSTALMDFIGGLSGIIFKNIILANFPFMLISFFAVKWTINKLEIRKYINNTLLLIIISLPHLCIWTSICSKEVFGLVFSAIFAVLIINFLNGNFKIQGRDLFAFYICFIFKRQYLPFIIQGLIFMYFAQKFLWKRRINQILLGLFFVMVNIIILFLIKDIINTYASGMYGYFSGGRSNRDNFFLYDNDFFKYIPWGMFIAFFGPTLSEMIQRPLQGLAGLESLFIIFLFVYLAKDVLFRFIIKGEIFIKMFLGYFFIFSGICFIHYPFGIFNPGSAIRYRTNFLFLFITLLLYLRVYYKQQCQYDCSSVQGNA